MLSLILNEVRRDALRKGEMDDLSQEELGILTDILSNIFLLANILRKEGLLSLEAESACIEEKTFPQVLIKKGISLIVDGNEPERVEEYLTTLYWAKEPMGIEAVASYCVIRGLCMMQLENHVSVIREMLLAAIPVKYQEICRDAMVSKLEEYEANLRAEEIKQHEDIVYKVKDWEVFMVVKSFEDTVRAMDDISIQRLLHDVSVDDMFMAMIGASKNTRDSLFAKMPEQFKEVFASDFFCKFSSFMNADKKDEMEIKLAAENILDVIERLEKLGELPTIRSM